MLKFLAVLAPAAVLVATPAAAQEAPQGSRAELLIGYDHIKTGDELEDLKSDGLLYGVGLGYDFRVAKSFSLGIDVEASDSTIDEDESGTVDGVDYDASVNLRRDLYAGIRATFPISDRANVYIKGGVTNVDAKYNITLDDGVDVVSESFSQDDTGYRVGAGLQIGVGKKSFISTEYRFSDYGDGLDRHQVTAGLGIRF